MRLQFSPRFISSTQTCPAFCAADKLAKRTKGARQRIVILAFCNAPVFIKNALAFRSKIKQCFCKDLGSKSVLTMRKGL